ncbi:MAG TPA: lipopolysaccharide biosynthesis protein [Sphingomicrobium sp.]|jgi:O-antigen/teichoic acid export membrane protein
MRHWFKDSSLQSLLKNSSYLAISRIAAGLGGVATLGFAGRALGPVLFGVLILIHSYAQLANGLAKFQSWQLVIRYGSPALASGDRATFQQATGFALALDLASGFGGMVIAMALLPFIGTWFKIPPEYIGYAVLYCLIVPAMAAAAPVGVLRAVDRFDLIGWQGTVTPIVRVVLVAAAWATDAPFAAYLAAWFISTMAGELYMWIIAWREMRRRELLAGMKMTLRPRELPGAWRFAVNVNLATSMNAARGPLSQLLVGVILGPAATGLYRIAKTLAEAIEKPADLLNKAFYPEVMRLDLATKRPWKLMMRGAALSAMVGALVCLLIVVAGKPLITAIFGAKYVGSYAPTIIMLVGTFLGVITFPVTPMLYAMHKTGAPVIAKLVGIGISLIALYPLCVRFGLTGAAISYVLGSLISIGMTVAVLYRAYRGLHPVRPAIRPAE